MKELYKILLVDDEEEVRKSIIKKINWEEEGFLVVGDAENGVEALEKIENLNPDLVFTDIRMPYMDGLELINEINIRYPLIKSIIFSGFDDFDYAKEAIKMGVIEYVLKPVSAVELTEILRKVHKSMDEELDKKRDIERLRRGYQASIPILREQFLNGIIHGSISASEIDYAMSEYDINLNNADRYMVAAVHIDDMDSHIVDKELIPIYNVHTYRSNTRCKQSHRCKSYHRSGHQCKGYHKSPQVIYSGKGGSRIQRYCRKRRSYLYKRYGACKVR